MFARIGYRFNEELQVNVITFYMLFRSDVMPEAKENEIVIPYDKLPEFFIEKYQECTIEDGRVVWSPILYQRYRYPKKENIHLPE